MSRILCSVVCLTVVMWSSSAFACKCKMSSKAQALSRAHTAVFGKIYKGKPLKAGHVAPWVLKVEQSYKGGLDKGALIEIKKSNNSCRFSMREGVSYMLYLGKDKDDLYHTNMCSGSHMAKTAPAASADSTSVKVSSILARVPKGSDVKTRVASATNVYVVQVKKTGRPFAGSWHGVTFEGKIKQAFRGQRKGKVTLEFDQKACQKRKKILSDDDSMTLDKAKTLIKVGGSYLVYTYGESPERISACHGNLVPVESASTELDTLKTLCKKGACQKLGPATLAATTMRKNLRKELVSNAQSSIETCHKPIKKGIVTKVVYMLKIKNKGKVSIRNVQTAGTVLDGKVYDAMVSCLIKASKGWSISSFEGHDVKAKMTINVNPKSKRRLKFASDKLYFSKARR